MDSPIRHVIEALRRLDVMLESAVASARTSGEPGAAPSLRGLYIAPEEAASLLTRAPGAPTLGAGRVAGGSLFASPLAFAPLASLAESFQLGSFDLDVILVALAPELDLRYERLYGYLQDDVTRRRASVDLALNLLTSTAEEKLARHASFALEAPLIRHGLVHLVPDPHHVQPPLLAHYLKLDEQIVRMLTGQQGMDRRLENLCRLVRADAPADAHKRLPLACAAPEALSNLFRRARHNGQALKLYFCGRRGSGKLTAATALAGECGLDVLIADLARWPKNELDFEAALRVTFREAALKGSVLYIDGIDVLRRDEQSMQFARLMEAVAAQAGVVILSGSSPWVPDGRIPVEVVSVVFELPGFESRRAHWEANLAAEGVALAGRDLDALAGRFRLTPGQIEGATCSARGRARWRAAMAADESGESTGPHESPIILADLFTAARAQCGHELAKLARKVEPKQTWDDIVLPPDPTSQLREVCEQARFRHLVYGEWGFDRKLSLGKGLNALFAGPPGTGKTMAAEVIAHELQLDLYKIDLSQVVSKYIGETEKNLDRIFTAAESANAILLFDEADALFGKRSEVKDSHDRYANVEIGYLLQKMEEYEGVAILATNLRRNLDEAFVRRMHFVVDFPFPDEAHRRRIWEVTFPRQAPIAAEVDYGALAREVKLAGGNIKNIALGAAFYAAADGRVINPAHLARAARREHQKLGRAWNEASLLATGGQAHSSSSGDAGGATKLGVPGTGKS